MKIDLKPEQAEWLIAILTSLSEGAATVISGRERGNYRTAIEIIDNTTRIIPRLEDGLRDESVS